ncbi:hypothetical protein SK128_028047, partial [Halocaridina rubra]
HQREVSDCEHSQVFEKCKMRQKKRGKENAVEEWQNPSRTQHATSVICRLVIRYNFSYCVPNAFPRYPRVYAWHL